jgi:subtilase family serine protease
MSLTTRVPQRGLALAAAVLAAMGLATASIAKQAPAKDIPLPVLNVGEFSYLKAGETPPTQAECASAGRRCFSPSAEQAVYNVTPLHAQGLDGRGKTIAVVDSFGYDQAASDLKVFSQRFGLPLMCGMPDVSCQSGMGTFSELKIGNRPVKEPPGGSNGTGLEQSNAWALEIALDLQWAHTMAPGANLLLLDTSDAETLGVQGLPQMMDLEQQAVDGGLADVISQSFGTGEEAFHSTSSLLNLRHAFVSAQAKGVTMLASSGDGGSENDFKTPVKNPDPIPFPSVGWPASDPLVTSVGGTFVCMDPQTGTQVDNTSPGDQCDDPANAGQREVGWVDAGGGFSHVFSKPDYQNSLPAGSTAIGSMRGVPDIAAQASSKTGVLVYDTAPGDATSGVICQPSASPCSAGWYVVGGTSSASPQWAGLVAIADQIAGKDLGLINDDLYTLANSPNYGSYFFDVSKGNNSNPAFPDIPGFPATKGWDPITGLGTPNAATLIPALAAQAATTAP